MISVIIPAYNEGESIAATIAAIWTVPEVGQLLVVDDGSEDETAFQAADAGAQVLRLPRNMGKGAALNRGAGMVTESYIALLDGELGASAGQLGSLAQPVLNGTADLAIAKFPTVKGSGGLGLLKGLSGCGIWLTTGLRLASPLSGQRVMTRRTMELLMPFAEGYGVEVVMTIEAARRGLRVLEVPTGMVHRTTGRDWAGFKHRGRQFVEISRALMQLCRQE